MKKYLSSIPDIPRVKPTGKIVARTCGIDVGRSETVGVSLVRYEDGSIYVERILTLKRNVQCHGLE